MNPKLLKAKDLAETQPDEAMWLCNQVLNDSFDEEDGKVALFMAGYLMMQAERYGIAYHIFKRCAELNPTQSEIYSNMGMCLEEYNQEEACKMFDKAFELNPNNYRALANKGLMKLQTGFPEECIELSNKALGPMPLLQNAIHNRGLARLMLRDYGGWEDYRATLGVKHREARDYGYKEWNGEEGGTVVVYGEQGVGDEIMFASCLPDLSDSSNVVFDCDARLESIFKRSFPHIDVYGTRFKTESPIIDNYKGAKQTAIGQLPYYYRQSEDKFPGQSYLVADPERVKQWGSLLSKDKKKIGIAWSGGLPSTGEKKRSTSVTDFEELFKLDAEFVSLEYKDIEKASKDYLDYNGVKHWDRAVKKGCDLEETFALVKNLDAVVTVCTTIVYVAGSLGVPCFVLVPDVAGYRYYKTGEKFPWFNSVKLVRGDFKEGIKKCLKFL